MKIYRRETYGLRSKSNNKNNKVFRKLLKTRSVCTCFFMDLMYTNSCAKKKPVFFIFFIAVLRDSAPAELLRFTPSFWAEGFNAIMDRGKGGTACNRDKTKEYEGVQGQIGQWLSLKQHDVVRLHNGPSNINNSFHSLFTCLLNTAHKLTIYFHWRL